MKWSVYLVFGLFGVNVLAQALSPKEECTLHMDPGTGEEQQPQFFYSEEKKMCLPFYYKGAGGNGNRFATDKACMEACSDNLAAVYPSGGEVCGLPQDPGMCLGRFIKFFFSKEEGTCRTFLYGGCTGNGNRFDTREDCLQTCLGKSGRSGPGEMGGSDPNPDEYTGNSGLIAGVLGGCIFAVALISAIAVLVKNKTSGRKKVPAQDIELS
ncbi:hypothetical protein COCON_G00164860 [Conger conger]|uniref:BPTI/Kunitz inhibitor domain-containing protein n=1 Tax=Conger conger TaxID=82655 RepID=A0A9Q1HTV5_CONCO|nr:kunitz-type serine protease inhibitor bitisilin-3 [Conger conger]KAJ8260763.1 hypothetical protein COCON_G00164860 [Conger conger]